MKIYTFWLDSCSTYARDCLNNFLEKLETNETVANYSLQYYTTKTDLVVVVEVEYNV